MVTSAFAEPAALVAVSVYVVVVVRLTDLLEPVTAAWLSERLAAPETDQERVMVPPPCGSAYLSAVNEAITGTAGCCSFTVTVAVAVVDPAELVAVRVQVVVAETFTATLEPVTLPIP